MILFVIAAILFSLHSPGDAVRQQGQFFINRDYVALWQSYTPQYQKVCNHKTWLAKTIKSRNSFTNRSLRIKVYDVITQNDRSAVSYRWYYDQKPILSIQGDIFVRVNGKWLDAMDSITRCP